MLQVKNLTKIYNANGVAVKALDDVSLSFGDSGMCFVLGKSGSGKSTFLNVCGGLDAPDSGEIIVKNRSSKDFTTKDFDSYRNTFIGFIFQEYNVLNEFTVEDNVMLALELQGKKKDKAVVDSILEKVDLKGLNKRKPNTLSGGQKQRVAIARALVKNPEIIMADEPSGALDSETGKQVFDTLKKLSRDKLVLVVSHDREFAEKYADRIIELKDGKVLSDVTKQVCEADEKENVSQVNANTLFVKRGRKLTEEDIEKIRHVVENSNSDVLITSDEKGVDEYKKNNDVTDASSGSFVETVQPQQRKYTDEESTFIRSTLPMRHAVRVGASGIKLKPVRFAFTLLLSIISFVMFGMLSCLMFYDSATVTANSLYDYGWNYVEVKKSFAFTSEYVTEYGRDKYVQNLMTTISDDDVDIYREMLGNDTVFVAAVNDAEITNLQVKNNFIYSNRINSWIDSSGNLQYIEGKAPTGNGEVAISEYLYDSIRNGTLKDGSGVDIKVNSYSDIVLLLQNNRYPATETGGFATDEDSSDTVTLKVSGVFKCDDLYKQWEQDNTKNVKTFTENLYNAFFGCVAIDMTSFDYFVNTFGRSDGSVMQTNASGKQIEFSDFDLKGNYNLYRLYRTSVYNTDGEQVKAGSRSLVVPAYDFLHDVLYVADEWISTRAMADSQLNEMYQSVVYDDVSYTHLVDVMNKCCNSSDYAGFLKNYKYFVEFVKQNASDIWNKIVGINISCDSTVLTDEVVFSFDTHMFEVGEDSFRQYVDLCRKGQTWSLGETRYDFTDVEKNKYSSMFAKVDSLGEMQSLLKGESVVNDDDTLYQVVNGVKSNITFLSETVSVLSKVFLWAGIVMAVFSMLLLFNFITASIHAKRKEIGILRALGASGGDVFKIFMSESAIVVIICSIVSVILTGVISSAVNASVSAQFGIPFSMFTFGIVSVAMIFGIAVVAALISTFLPVYLNARKRPVEAIRQL